MAERTWPSNSTGPGIIQSLWLKLDMVLWVGFNVILENARDATVRSGSILIREKEKK